MTRRRNAVSATIQQRMKAPPKNQMNRSLHSLCLILAAASLLAGCASTPKDTDPAKAAMVPPEKWKFKTADDVLKDADVKGKPPEVFQKPIEEVRAAALRALSFVGCHIKHREDFYVMGRRPNKMG